MLGGCEFIYFLLVVSIHFKMFLIEISFMYFPYTLGTIAGNMYRVFQKLRSVSMNEGSSCKRKYYIISTSILYCK